MSAAPQPGDVVIAMAGTKERFCVVLDVRDGVALVVSAGYGNSNDPNDVKVSENSRAWKAMGLTKTTYFKTTVERVRLESARATAGKCPPDVHLAIRKRVGFR